MKAQGVQLLPLLLCIVSTCWGQQVSLSLGSGRTITTNNMEILITDIGEDAPGGLPSLTCHTDLTTCCRSNADNNGMGALGQWTYPNRSVIPQNGGSANAGQQFYINRNAPKLIRLNRRQGNNPLTPTGSYCCTVPTTGGDMTICANLVPPLCFDNLPTISNGGITYNNGQATYNCFGDYRLVGDAMRTCGSEGIWGGSAPVCQQITCSDLLPTLTNGVISYSDGSTGIRPVGTTATYSCTNGYRLVGEAMRTCGSEGTWSGSAPVCQQITCSDLSTLANGDINYGAGSTNSRPVDTVATYSCNFGYTINGGSTRTCESDGNDKVWSGSPPTCQQITCSDLPTLIVSYDGGSTDIRPVDTGATYSCDTGYTINGDTSRICGVNRMWSGSTPTCRATCPDLPVPTNGMISYSSSTSPCPEGATVTQSCLNGYVPATTTSTTTRVCLANRSWSGSPLTCEVPPVPPVYVSLGTTNYAGMNSQVDINTIGEADDQALICRTNNAQCCRGSDGLAAGEWRFPSGEVVPRRSDVNTSVPFVSSRGVGILRLHRRGSVSGPTGSYCCVIPDSTGVDMTFCVRLVTTTAIVTSTTSSSSLLSCGPPRSIDNGYPGQPTSTMIGGEATYT